MVKVVKCRKQLLMVKDSAQNMKMKNKNRFNMFKNAKSRMFEFRSEPDQQK